MRAVGVDARVTESREDESSLLEVTDLAKVFVPPAIGLRRGEPFRAVSDVTFSMARGQTLAVVGESGSGKSTMAKCIAGLMDASSGSVRLSGERVDCRRLKRDANLRKRIQMVFQDPSSSLNPRHGIGRILSEPLLVHRVVRGRSAADEVVAALLESVGMPASAMERLPHEFSGGQRQRIAIARAIALDPALVVCDEPVSGLDVSVQAQVINLLKQLQREKQLSFLFITHDMAVVRHVADRVLVMQRGHAVEVGEVESVLSAPRNPYTRALMAAVPQGLGAVKHERLTRLPSTHQAVCFDKGPHEREWLVHGTDHRALCHAP